MSPLRFFPSMLEQAGALWLVGARGGMRQRAIRQRTRATGGRRRLPKMRAGGKGRDVSAMPLRSDPGSRARPKGRRMGRRQESRVQHRLLRRTTRTKREEHPPKSPSGRPFSSLMATTTVTQRTLRSWTGSWLPCVPRQEATLHPRQRLLNPFQPPPILLSAPPRSVNPLLSTETPPLLPSPHAIPPPHATRLTQPQLHHHRIPFRQSVLDNASFQTMTTRRRAFLSFLRGRERRRAR
jgi:hypothetical protein